MATSEIGLNKVFPIYMGEGEPFNGLVLRKAVVDSIVMSLGDKITGDVYYKDNALNVTMREYVVYNDVRYYIVNPPTIVREGMVSDNSELKGMTKYSFEFYHPMYMLANFPFTDVAVTSSEGRYLSQNKTFAWIGYLKDYVDKLNANLDGTEWVVKMSDKIKPDKLQTLSDVLSFDNATIADALKTGYETWEVPFVTDQISTADAEYSRGKRFAIIFGLPSNEIIKDGKPFVFKFGQGVGLKNNSATPKNNKIITRIAGYGSEDNIPYGYPQIVWEGSQDATETPNGYPIYDGIVGGRNVKLIKHPFTRTHLMPSIYTETVNKKVNPYASGYNPNIQIIDYYDAIESAYPNKINPLAPSYEIHEFADIKPELGEETIGGASPYDLVTYRGVTTISWGEFMKRIDEFKASAVSEQETTGLNTLVEALGQVTPETNKRGHQSSTPEYWCKWEFTVTETYYHIKYESAHVNFEYNVLFEGAESPTTPTVDWNDNIDDNGNYVQSYFKITLPMLSFDIYACAAITQEMQINMRSGACIGCTFPVQVDWDDYKNNFYDADGTFNPYGEQRNYERYPDSTKGSIEVIVQKDIDTFGTIMPNIYQQPKAGDKFVVLGISLPTSYISNAEQRLDEAMKEYMLENNVYYFDYPLKFDEFFLAQNTDILSQIHNNTIVRFDVAGVEKVLYVKQMTVKFGEKPLPQYNITLTDDIEIVLNQIGQVTDDVSRMRVQLSELEAYYNTDAGKNKLSKVDDDTAKGFITFMQGFQVGNSFLSGLLGSGGVFRRNADGTTYIEADKLYVRMKAYFDNVEIKDYKHTSGNRIASLAGMRCCRVDYVDNKGNIVDIPNVYAYRCYFKAEDDTDTITNDFVVGDLAFCDKTTIESALNKRRYWRAVVGKNTELTADGEAWIDLSYDYCEKDSDIPLPGDDIIQLGNKNDTTRQGAIIEYVGGEDAPSYQIFQGIGQLPPKEDDEEDEGEFESIETMRRRFSLEDKCFISLGYSSFTGRAYLNVYGDSYIGARDQSTYMKYDSVKKELNIKAKISIESTIGDKPIDEYIAEQTASSEDIKNFIEQVIGDDLEEIQKQIDGVIETWFIDEEPTLTNAPAKDWTTEVEREKHSGDLCYDNTTGTAYRFSKDENGNWFWNVITDEAITKALAAAKAAQDTADGKRRVFVDTPKPPYDAGDLWANATYGTQYNNDLLRCAIAKKNESDKFEIDDWVLATNYTDDTLALAAQKAAEDAAKQAEAANDRLNDWASDSYISPQEKTALKQQHNDINSEYQDIIKQAEAYGIPMNEFADAYKKASDALTKYTQDTPENIPVESDYNDISAYYAARQRILEAIATAIKNAVESSSSLVVTMSNEYQGIPADADGNIVSFPNCETNVGVFYGSLDVSSEAAYTTTAVGLTGSWNNANRTYTVTSLLQDTGYVDIKATYKGLSTTKRFNVVKVRAGQTGTSGTSVTIVSTSVTYQKSTSGTITPTGEWLTNIPTTTAGEYLWTRTIVSYSDGKSTTSYSVAAHGAQGASVTIVSTSVTYAVTSNASQPTDSEFTSPTVPSVGLGQYLWCKTEVTYSEGTVTKSYSVSRIGADGETGTPGAPGDDGRTTYIHIAYANNDTGTDGFSTTYFDGALYLGTCTDYNEADPTDPSAYEWARLKGEDGSGSLKSFVFIRSASTPPAPNGGSYANPVPAGWSDGIPAENGQPAWMSSRVFTSDGLAPQTAEWTTPQKVSDTADIDFEFSAVEDNPGTPTTNPTNWHNDATENDVWMAVRKQSNGIWGDWDVSKIKGEEGDPGRTYILEASTLAMKRGYDNALTPTTVTFSAFYRDGDSATRTAYAGRFVIAESTNGSTFTNKYTSTANESSRTYAPSAEDVAAIRCTLYAAGGTTYALDVQTTVILTDVSNIQDILDDIQRSVDDALNEAEDVRNVVNKFWDNVNEAFRDGVIDDNEWAIIKSYLNVLKKEMEEARAAYDVVYENPYLTGTAKTNLADAKGSLESAFVALISRISIVIADRVVTDTESQQVDDAFDNFSTAYAVFTEKLNEANKAIQDYIKGIAVAASSAAANAQADADAAQNRLDLWADDGVISPDEKQGIKDEIERINSDSTLIKNAYQLYGLGTPTAYNAAYNIYKTQLEALSEKTPEVIVIPSDFRTNQSEYYTQRTAALQAIDNAIKNGLNELHTEIAGYEYLQKALVGGRTEHDGGLFLASLIQLGVWNGLDLTVWSGLNGLTNTSKGQRGIAAWYGGDMLDAELDGKTGRCAQSLFRFDGSGYLAGGNITWDTAGRPTMNEATVNGVIYASSFFGKVEYLGVFGVSGNTVIMDVEAHPASLYIPGGFNPSGSSPSYIKLPDASTHKGLELNFYQPWATRAIRFPLEFADSIYMQDDMGLLHPVSLFAMPANTAVSLKSLPYSPDDWGWVLQDSTGVNINTSSAIDPTQLEAYLTSNGYLNNVSVSGSGNVVTNVTQNGKSIVVTKGITALTSADLTNYVKKSGDTMTGNLTFPQYSTGIVFSATNTDVILYLTGDDRLAFGSYSARGINAGNLLVSNAWADSTKVPTNGIYSKGVIASGVTTGTAPLSVSSTTVVSNLNADMLDGKHDGELTASKLATSRTLWGQSFDGTANVSGDMSDVGNIFASGSVNAVNFNATTAQGYKINTNHRVADTWAGYNSSTDTLIVGLASSNLQLRAGATVDGALIATQSWVQSQGYLTGVGSVMTLNTDQNIASKKTWNASQQAEIADGNMKVAVSMKGIDFTFKEQFSITGGGGETTVKLASTSAGTLAIDNDIIATRSWVTNNFSGGGTASSVAWGNITGKPSYYDANILKNFYASRPSSANVNFGDGSLRHFKATSSMTTGYPYADAHILHFAWDNTNNYDSQLAVINNPTYSVKVQYRTQNGSAGWQNWINLIDETNIGSYNAGSATKLQAARTLWGQSFDGTGDVSGSLSGVDDIVFNYGSGNRRVAIKKNGAIYFDSPTSGGFAMSLASRDSNENLLTEVIGIYGEANIYKYIYLGGAYNNPQVAILPNGNVGIGTASPLYKLHVAGTIGASDNITMGGNLVATQSWVQANTMTTNTDQTLTGGKTWITSRASLNTNTSVGIGSGGITFTYNDIYNVTLSSTAQGTLTVDGVLRAKAFDNSSDIRLKEITRAINLSVEDIAQAPSVVFRWKDIGMLSAGSIAQYWQNVIPEAVTADNDGYLSMQYGNLALISAINIARKVVSHEERIKALEKENEELRRRIEEISE